MSLFTVDCKCRDCGLITDLFVERDKRNDTHECPECHGTMDRVYLSVNNFRAAYHDGIRRKGLREAAEGYAMEAEAYSLPPDQRGELLKEANILKNQKK